MVKQKAVFLDADGVLNNALVEDGKPKAPTKLNQLVIPDEVGPILQELKNKGYLLICVTNKPDIERGLMTQADLDAIMGKLWETLPLDDIYICYHAQSECYKPNPGMLLAAAKKYQIDLVHSFMIGDRWRDIGAGQNAGCKTVWINRHYNEREPEPPADHEAKSLQEAKDWILQFN